MTLHKNVSATKPSVQGHYSPNHHLRETGCLLPNMANAGGQQSCGAANDIPEDILHAVE
jgi:hypothetical protein